MPSIEGSKTEGDTTVVMRADESERRQLQESTSEGQAMTLAEAESGLLHRENTDSDVKVDFEKLEHLSSSGHGFVSALLLRDPLSSAFSNIVLSLILLITSGIRQY